MSSVNTKPQLSAAAQQDLQKAVSDKNATTMSTDVAKAVAASGLTGKDVGRAVLDYLHKLNVSGSTTSSIMHLLPEGDEPSGKADFGGHSHKGHGTGGADGTTATPPPSTSTPTA